MAARRKALAIFAFAVFSCYGLYSVSRLAIDHTLPDTILGIVWVAIMVGVPFFPLISLILFLRAMGINGTSISSYKPR